MRRGRRREAEREAERTGESNHGQSTVRRWERRADRCHEATPLESAPPTGRAMVGKGIRWTDAQSTIESLEAPVAVASRKPDEEHLA
jgi:hypothetical protein